MIKKLFVFVFLCLSMVTVAQANKSIVVNLSQQRATAYNNGKAIFSGRISSGKASRPTPTGHFRVLEKDIDHVSSSWPKPRGGARMHYMLRVTGYGIAMHLGHVPNYPASHGCIRMTNGFAQKMYRWASVGTPITIVGRGHRGFFGRSNSNRQFSALEMISSNQNAKNRQYTKKKTKKRNKKRHRRAGKKKHEKKALLKTLRG